MQALVFQIVIGASALFCGGASIGYRFNEDEPPITGICTTMLGAALIGFALAQAHG